MTVVSPLAPLARAAAAFAGGVARPAMKALCRTAPP